MTNKNQTFIILDRSGSMQSIRHDTINGFNQFLKDQQKNNPDCQLSLVQFDHEIDDIYIEAPIKEVSPLNPKTYVPRGTTSLLDAIGFTLDKASIITVPKTQNAKVIVVIITDGQENSSTTFNKDQVFDKIKLLKEKHNWQFIFLGANQDAIQEAQHLGISREQAMTFASDKDGTLNMFIDLSHNINLCVNDNASLEFTKAQRTKQSRKNKES